MPRTFRLLSDQKLKESKLQVIQQEHCSVTKRNMSFYRSFNSSRCRARLCTSGDARPKNMNLNTLNVKSPNHLIGALIFKMQKGTVNADVDGQLRLSIVVGEEPDFELQENPDPRSRNT